MDKYIKPEINVLTIEIEASILFGSDPQINQVDLLEDEYYD